MFSLELWRQPDIINGDHSIRSLVQKVFSDATRKSLVRSLKSPQIFVHHLRCHTHAWLRSNDVVVISNCQHWVKLLLLLPAAYPSDAVKIHTDYLLLSPDFGHDLGDLGMGARNSALTTSGVDESSSSSSRRMKSIKESKAAVRVG